MASSSPPRKRTRRFTPTAVSTGKDTSATDKKISVPQVPEHSPELQRQAHRATGHAGGAGEPAEHSKSQTDKARLASDYCPATEVKGLLYKKFQNVQIFVDNIIPTKVWFLEKGIGPDLQDFHEVVYLQGDPRLDIIPYKDKWQSTAQTDEKMTAVMSLFDEMANCLHWDDDEKGWKKSHVKEYEKMIDELDEKHPGLWDSLNPGRLPMVFEEGMMNATGRRAIEAIFTTAALVAFGRKELKTGSVGVIPVGSSRAPHERFPVGLYSGRGLEEVDYNLRDITGISGSSSGKEHSSTKSSQGKDELYADVIVVSGCNPLWPHFLFVAEIKSEPTLTDKCRGQMLREMLAPIMHQTSCFGLLINSNYASLYIMEHDKKKKKIYVSVSHYRFKSEVHGKFHTHFKFDADGLKMLFIDIVASMDYGKSNIERVHQSTDAKSDSESD